MLTGAKEIARELLDQLKVLLEVEREVLETAGDADDEGTIDLMTGFITSQEKTVWMLTAFVS